MSNNSEYPTATPESVWAALRETDRLIKESRADFERRMKQREEEAKASRADFERRIKQREEEAKASRADFERRMKKYDDILGSWSNNHGSFAEEYFFNSFENGKQNFFGEKFDKIRKNLNAGIEDNVADEYDIVLINGSSVGIVEVKYKAHENDIPKVLKKAKTFRANFPKFKKHKVYLGLASLAFYPELEQECINEGIAVVKQVGDTVVINDEHLKVF
jgi:hypothetical protein